MPALGVPRDVDRNKELNRFQFYLDLGDALLCKAHPSASHLRELSDSFCHDVLNLATLASRLLWYEGVTPEMWRSHDLISVGVDAESYFVMLQSACDIMADVIATLGAVKKGQTPWESFHKLSEWAVKNPKRLQHSYQLLVGTEMPWFAQINGVRTKIVHRGGDVWVYTERTAFEWDVHLPGAKVSRGTYLLSSLQSLTRAMLNFSELLGAIIASEEDRRKNPKKRIIDGLYVPALHHLLRYKVPKHDREHLLPVAHCLLVCGGYVEAGLIGYPDGFWWQLILTLATKTTGLISARIYASPSGLVDDCAFVFSDGKKRYGFIAYDIARKADNWQQEAAESAGKVQTQYSADRVAVVVRVIEGDSEILLPDTKYPLIVGNDLATISARLFETFVA